MLLSICRDIWKLCVATAKCSSECKYSSTNVPFGVQVHPLSDPNLVCSFPQCLIPSAYLLSFLILPFSGLFLPLSLKHHALLLISRGELLWSLLESPAVSSSCRTPVQGPLQIICKAGTTHICIQMSCSVFPHEDSRQYARKLSISDGEMTPERHSDSLCQSRRDKFSFQIRCFWPCFSWVAACYHNTNGAQCLSSRQATTVLNVVPNMRHKSFLRIKVNGCTFNTQASRPGLEKQMCKEWSDLLAIWELGKKNA